MPGLAHSSVRSISRSLLGTSTGVPSRVELTYHGLNKQAPSLNGVVKDETVGRGTDRPEEPGRCLDFDGASEAALGSLTFATSDRTLSAWIRTTDAPNPGYIISSRSGNAGGLSVVLNSDGTIGIRVAATTKTSGTRVVNDGNWHLITVVYASSNDTISIYVDGSLDVAYVSGTAQVEQVWEIASYDGATFRYTGKLFDLQIFDKALSASEVHQLYTIGLNTDRLVWLKLEEVSGDYCYDSSGNNNTATLSGHTSSVRYTGSDVPTSGLNKVGYSTYAYFAGTDSSRFTISTTDTIASNSQGSVSVFASLEAFNGSTLNAILDISGTGSQGLGIWSNYLGAARFTYGNGTLSAVGITLTPHKRHHLGIAWNGSTIKFYVDGVLVSTKTDATLSLVAPIKYFGGGSSTGRNHKGTIEDFRTYATTLTDADMAKLANSESIAADPHYHIPLNERSGNVFNEVVNGTTFTMTSDHSWQKYGRNEGNKAQDLLTGPLQVVGEAPRNGQLENSYCRVFDGVDDRIATGLSSLTKANNHSGRIRFRTDSTVAGTLFANTTAVDNRFLATFQSDILRIGCYDGTTYAAKSVAFTDTSEWHVLEWEYDSSGHTLTATLDGVEMTGTDAPAANAAVGSYIGCLSNVSGFYDGELCDLQTAVDDTVIDWLPLSDSHQDSAVNVVNPANSGTPAGHNSSFVGRQPVFAYNAAKGSSRRMNRLCNNSTTTANQFHDQVTLSYVDDPWGTQLAVRQVPSNTTTGSHRVYTTANTTVEAGQFLVAYIKSAGRDHFGFIFSGNGSNSYFQFSDNTVINGNQAVVHNSDYGNGWRKVVWKILNTGTSAVLQVFAHTSSGYTPANTTDGVDYFFGIVDDWETQDIRQTTTLAILSDRIPALQDGSGKDAAGLPIMYPSSPGVWPLSENTLNSNPNNAPRRDWSLPVNLVEHDLTNWSLQSQTLDRGILGPDGDFTAFRINNLHQTDGDLGVSRTISSGIVGGAPYTGSFWIKGEGSDIGKNVSLRLKRGAGVGPLALQDTDFELSGEWQLASHSLTLDSANTHMITGISGAASSNKASSVLIWNPQLEAGSVAGPPMPFGYDPNEPSDFTPNPPNVLPALTSSGWGMTNGTPVFGSDVQCTASAGSFTSTFFNTTNGVMEAGKPWKVEIELKADVGDTARIRMSNAVTGQCSVEVNLSTGVVVSATPGTGFSNCWAYREDLGSGWYKFTCIAIPNETTQTARVSGIYLENSGDVVRVREVDAKRYHPTNPLFFRQRTDAGKLVGIDRLTDYKQPLLGGSLSRVQNFVIARTL